MDSTNQDNDDTIIGVAATSVLATRVAIIVFYEHESNIPREPYVNKDQEREFYMNSILNGSDVHYVGQIRMRSAHDSRILNDALERPHGLQIPQGPSIEKDVQATEVSQIKASRKRKHSFEMQDIVGDISIKFGEVATIIGRMIDSRLDVTKLYEEVMAMEGYNEDFLSDAFDYSMTHLLGSTTQPLKLIPTDESPVANQQNYRTINMNSIYESSVATDDSSITIDVSHPLEQMKLMLYSCSGSIHC
ncbi:hypothetical protein T459_02667 [Capsicum annuum]|uniref:Uncharacterized protein n=1 Tax=Capsicum annuum TaxID=4072 RepID=A0A2G3AKM6_CAPAN|nr:hypothetical protein T459_02667 [Capsicum annuum]